MSRVDKEQFVTSLARGLAVLKAFGSASPEMTLSQVAAVTDLSPAAVRRFLLTLVHLGYLSHVEKKFVLTPRIMELSASYLDSMNLAEVAHPHLQQIRDDTGDSVSLTVLDGPDIIHLCHVPTQRLLRFAVTAGSRVPAYVSATGRAILAYEPEYRLAKFFERAELTARTPHTLTSEDELRKRLRDIREDGYALVVDELDLGITVIGCPIVINGAAVAGISCATASGYLSVDEFVAQRLPILEAASARLRTELTRFPTLLHSLVMH